MNLKKLKSIEKILKLITIIICNTVDTAPVKVNDKNLIDTYSLYQI